MVIQWTVVFYLLYGGGLADSPPPMVKTRSGVLKGTVYETRSGKPTEAYLGIPYAKPPLGELRFESPVPADPWEGVRSADTMPPACIQNRTTVGPRSEDCLYLNVFTPGKRSNPKLPVMVWIYGGSFQNNAISTFTPEYMLDQPIVLVCIQYRLGFFGFLSTGDCVLPGNQGLKDQRLGLRWVRDNIAQFGGDPSKVTIFGQSAGAMSVHALMLFVPHEGLFRAGICQSGVSLLTEAFHLPKEVSFIVQRVANLSGCPTDSRGFVDCLKKLPAESILELLTQYQYSTPVGQFYRGGFPFPGLVLEADCAPDSIVTANPWTLRIQLPFLTGNMDREMLEFLAPIEADQTNTLFARLEASYNVILPLSLNYQYSSANGSGLPAATRKYYLQDQPISRATFDPLIVDFSDAFFIYGMFEAVQRSNVRQTYVYMFEYIGANHNYRPLPPNETVGAAHEDDVYFFFPHPRTVDYERIYSEEDEILSKKLVRLWTNFATYLKPTTLEDEVPWKPFGTQQYYYNFGKTSIYLKSSFLPERMEFWKKQPFVNRDDKLAPIQCDCTSRQRNVISRKFCLWLGLC